MYVQVGCSYSGTDSSNFIMEGLVFFGILLVAVASGERTRDIWQN
jgi:hypothetical protein